MVRKKGPYTPFPPPQQPSKIDLQLESGEFFLNQHTKRKKEAAAKREVQGERTAARHRDRAASLVAPQARLRPPVCTYHRNRHGGIRGVAISPVIHLI